MKKYSISADELKKYPAAELCKEIESNNLSVLMSLGADKLRKEMLPTGFICRTLVNAICKGNVQSFRKRACRLLRAIAPAELTEGFPNANASIAAGFNHPSLGEIFRLLYLGFEAWPDRHFLFPVNLPWYETLTPVIPKLDLLGVSIMPMITPSTERKLKEQFKDDPDKLDSIQSLKVLFERRYMRCAKEQADGRLVIFVAPSATRQASVFESEDASRGEGHIHPTMTLLAHMMQKGSCKELLFIPITIFEPKKNNRKLNLFKNYVISPCKAFDTEEIASLSSDQKRELDYLFLKRIEERYKDRP